MTEPAWSHRSPVMPAPRLSGLAAARKVQVAIEKLDALVADLSPREDESPAWTERAKAWAQLRGVMARIGLRIDAVVEVETGFKASKRPAFYSTVKRPEDPF